MSSGKVFEANEGTNWHKRVMIEMQERDLVLFLPQNEEYRVQELNQFAHVVSPYGTRHPHCDGIFAVVNWLTSEIVVFPPATLEAL